MNNHFSQDQINAIIEMYKSTANVDLIMETFSSDESVIREILKEYQIDRHYGYWTPELKNRVIEMGRKRCLHKEIKQTLLVSDHGIYKVFKNNNVEPLTYSERNRKFKRNSNYFDNIDTPEKAYFLGLLCSDGSNQTSHKQIIIALQEEDGYLIDKLKEALEYEGPIKIDATSHNKNPKHKITKKLVIEDIHMSERLEQIGMTKSKGLTFSFPTCVPKELLRHFVRGFFDGDGCVYFDKKRQKGTTQLVATFEFCNGLSEILSSLGIKHNIRNPKQSRGKNTHIIATSSTKSSYGFLSWMYEDCDVKMIRKFNKYLEIKKKYLEIYSM